MVRTTGTPEQRGMTVKRNSEGQIEYVIDKHGHMYLNKELIEGLPERKAFLLKRNPGHPYYWTSKQ